MKSKYTLKQMKDLAKERGGQCLSLKYRYRDMAWMCADGHKWESKPSAIRGGSWCPYCKWNVTEEKCRHIFRALTGLKFPRTRSVLPGGRELDGYCDKLKLAFEYNGQQHYQYIPFFHKRRGLSEIKCIDREKEKFCKDIGLLLIVIPYFKARADIELIEFIMEKVPLKYHTHVLGTPRVIMKDFYTNLSVFKRLQKIAKQHDGMLLSELYSGQTGRLEWECSVGHTWMCAPLSIKNGSWCPLCDGRQLHLNDAKKVAEFRGGKCISQFYENNRTPLEWECKKSHRWKASLDNVKSRSWCPVCAGKQKLTISEMWILAKTKGGKCLSKYYVNNSTKLKWQCGCGYVWMAAPNHIKNGTWCPKCSGQLMPTILDMQNLANQRDGKCLSNKYINAHTKLKWKCSDGHTWWANPTNIKQGKWCRLCHVNSMRIKL